MNIEKIIESIIEKKLMGTVDTIPSSNKPFLSIGKKVFIRAVTYHYVGQIHDISSDGFIVLTNCSWVADSGRFNHALATGELSEVEPMPGLVGIRIGSEVDISEWKHALPTEVK